MVIIKIFGGLGNQMFQYAFSVNYLMKGIKVKYDISSYDGMNQHNGFELDHVFDKIKVPLATPKDIFYFVKKQIIDGNEQYILLPNRTIKIEFKENEFSYDKSLQNLDNTFFSGYWQNELYFREYISEIRSLFSFKPIEPSDKQNIEASNLIDSTNSVSIHIRRGDYLSSPFHRNLTIIYYKRAIEKIKKLVKNPVFFVFSDDIPWVKENICERNTFYMEQNQGSNSFIDMHLMSKCKHNIMANSTFSWWAAWLNNHSDKIIITPAKWFTEPVKMDGLLLSDYIQIDL